MFKITSILLLSVFLLSQQTGAKTVEKNEAYVQLIADVFRDCVPISQFTIDHGTVIFEKVLEDVAVLKTPSEELQKHITELSDFVTAVKKHLKKHKHKNGKNIYEHIFELDGKWWDIIEKYNTTMLEKPTIENLLIEALVHKNGYEQFESGNEKLFLEMLEKFYPRVDAYIAGLTPAQHEEDKHFVDEWYPAFKAEHNTEKKERLFEDYLESVVGELNLS